MSAISAEHRNTLPARPRPDLQCLIITGEHAHVVARLPRHGG